MQSAQKKTSHCSTLLERLSVIEKKASLSNPGIAEDELLTVESVISDLLGSDINCIERQG